MILLVWILNFAISFLNAWGCGKTWNETKANGGMPHFLNWMAAIMSASGFSWCYLLITGFAGATIPIEHEVDGMTVSAPLLTPEMLQAFADLGFVMVWPPIIGSGLAITLHSWGVAWRNRTFSDTAVAGWNTFAMGNNIYQGISHMPTATGRLGDFFGGESDNKGKAIVLALVILCIAAGILTTYTIVTQVARSTAMNRSYRYADALERMRR